MDLRRGRLPGLPVAVSNRRLKQGGCLPLPTSSARCPQLAEDPWSPGTTTGQSRDGPESSRSTPTSGARLPLPGKHTRLSTRPRAAGTVCRGRGRGLAATGAAAEFQTPLHAARRRPHATAGPRPQKTPGEGTLNTLAP